MSHGVLAHPAGARCLPRDVGGGASTQPYLTAVMSAVRRLPPTWGGCWSRASRWRWPCSPSARLHTLLALLLGLMAALLAGLAYWVARRSSQPAGAPGPGRPRSASHRAGGRDSTSM